MEIKAKLDKPFTETQRIEFIVEQNHRLGYEIKYVPITYEVEETEITYETKIEEYEDIELIDDVETPITKEREVQIPIENKVTVQKEGFNLEAWGYTEDELLISARENKLSENTTKAKQSIEDGYVTYKEAEFETNAQTVGDLTATMLMMQSSGIESYSWLSKDDKIVDLTIEDFANLGQEIANYKNSVWNTKYIQYKTAIEEAKTIEELNAIVIDYTSNEGE